MWKLRLTDYVIAQGHPGGGAGHETQALCSSHLDRSLALALGGLTAFSESPPKPCQSACAHLLPWWWIPSSCHTVHWTDWTGPSVAGFFQVQVWFLNIAAPSLWEGYQLSLEGLLAAFHLPLPHTRTTGDRTLGAKKGDIEYEVKSAEQMRSTWRMHRPHETRGMGWWQVNHTWILKIEHQVPHATGEKTKSQRISVTFPKPQSSSAP